jgi:small GTP-binding protein
VTQQAWYWSVLHRATTIGCRGVVRSGTTHVACVGSGITRIGSSSRRLLASVSSTVNTVFNDAVTLDNLDFAPERIRNFSIVAHIDHGKTTLSNRILELTGVIQANGSAGSAGSAKSDLVLDNLQVERERGITVKAQTCTMQFEHNKQAYLMNLIDTPGHVDFSYEVSRSLTACEGAVLLVDAAQGIQAQTVANWLLAVDGGLEIVYAINKIDMANANVPAVLADLERTFGVDPDHVVRVSARTGQGVRDLLSAIVTSIPAYVGCITARHSSSHPQALLTTLDTAAQTQIQ